MRNSLFLKIYLTLLASLMVVALLGGLFVRRGQDEDDRGWGSRRARFIAGMFPPGDDPATLAHRGNEALGCLRRRCQRLRAGWPAHRQRR